MQFGVLPQIIIKTMFCPFCKKNGVRVIKGNEAFCSRCDALLEDFSGAEMEKPTLKCPKCEHYSRNDYCSHCGYEFKEGIDY